MINKLRKIFLVLIFSIFLISPFFIKVKTECRSNDGACPKEVEGEIRKIGDTPLFFAKKRVSTILSANYLVENYSLQFKLPNVLLVTTIIKKPVYAIYLRNTGKFYLTDRDGTILTTVENTNLTLIYKNGPDLLKGEKITQLDLFALRLIEGINSMYQINKGEVENDTLLVDMPGGIKVIFPLTDTDGDVLLGSLRLIFTKITNDFPGKYTQIDMRYKNPVLR